MDLNIFERVLKKAYPESHSSFTLAECREIFGDYFKAYRAYTGNEHPPLKTDKVIEIINQIDGGGLFTPCDYSILIECYFNTNFQGCDRNICHFFSGKVRELRFYETCL